MGRIFSANYLSPEHHAAVDACIRRRRFSNIDGMVAELHDAGIKISRSAMHRYVRLLKSKDGQHTGTLNDTIVMVVERGTGTVTTLTTGATKAAIVAMIESIDAPS